MSLARYTLAIMDDLTNRGYSHHRFSSAKDAILQRRRIHHAAKLAGFKVETRKVGGYITGRVVA